MEEMQLPIDVVPNTHPPIFRWKQTVDAIDGRRVVVQHEGALPPNVEIAVERTIGIAKQLLKDNAVLRGQVQGMSDRIAAQAEQLEKRAERFPPTALPPKKGRG
jgi:hypothetical protein